MSILVGSAPDSWGVWFASDPRQTPWTRFLDEVAEAGYHWTELGPLGYMPADPVVLAPELSRRNLSVSAGCVSKPLEDPAAWPGIERDIRILGRLLATLGARY